MNSTTDASGNSRTATFTNTMTSPGKFGEAQQFNGSSSRMTIPTFNVGAQFTLEAWVIMIQNTRSVVGAAREGTPQWWQAIIYKGKDDFYIAESGSFFTAGFTPKGGAPMVQLVSPMGYAPNTAHHVAATYDGAMFTLYVDGVSVASRAVTGEVFGSAEPVEVGGSVVDSGYLAGVIDDVRIYGRSLTAAEIGVDLATAVDVVREDTVSWDLEVFSQNNGPANGGMPISTGNFLRSTAMCNLAPAAPPATVQNPKVARVNDPGASGRECEFNIETLISGLPIGTGYTSIARAKGMTTVSERGAPSNPFDRVAISTAPPCNSSTTVK
jgi:hypothetical protein